ncbi:MAG: hypothetical protein K2X36_10845, partial [Microbacteriaceae bacterium]|nr:hypothetical protein [Microbacteriaceae bacterium]
MASPALSVSTRPPAELEGDALIVGMAPAPAGEEGVVLVGIEGGPLGEVAAGLRMLGLTGAVDETARVPAPAGVAA